jgi:penicillin-binding protein 2
VGIKANEKYNKSALAERLRDNALYTAFAPADKPKIVIAMVVENAGWGAEIAAPIARKALDFYLLGKRPTDKETTKVPKEDAAEIVPIEDPEAAEAAAAAAESRREPAPTPAPPPTPAATPAPQPLAPARKKQ